MSQESDQKYKLTVLRVGEESFEIDKKGVVGIEANPPMYAIHYNDDTIKAIYSMNKLATWKMKPVLIEVPNLVIQDAS